MKNPEHMTKKEKLAYIAALKRDGKHDEALSFWLRECPRISRKSFDECGN